MYQGPLGPSLGGQKEPHPVSSVVPSGETGTESQEERLLASASGPATYHTLDKGFIHLSLLPQMSVGPLLF